MWGLYRENGKEHGNVYCGPVRADWIKTAVADPDESRAEMSRRLKRGVQTINCRAPFKLTEALTCIYVSTPNP